ncbi:capsule biosynthesis protein, partial [Salmonella enterica]|nr:capsule biosynthesis protein [Salmonella enterica]
MRYSILALFVSAALLSVGASARSYTFNPALINDGAVDVSLFNEGLQLPGDYSVSITMNGEAVDNTMVSFRLDGQNGHQYLTPCLTPEQLSRYGVDVSKYPALSTNTSCADLSAIPQA